MPSGTRAAATLDDLFKVDGKAELIAGRIAHFMPSGRKPSRVASRIFRSLDDYAEASGAGEAYNDNVGYAVDTLVSGRQSFSPDASYFLGTFPENEMRILEGPLTFAVDVRSENDYGEAAEPAMKTKRADYFEAGTLVVWDVDPQAPLIRCYRTATRDQPIIFGHGDVADAEPAAPGWRLSVDDLS